MFLGGGGGEQGDEELGPGTWQLSTRPGHTLTSMPAHAPDLPGFGREHKWDIHGYLPAQYIYARHLLLTWEGTDKALDSKWKLFTSDFNLRSNK